MGMTLLTQHRKAFTKTFEFSFNFPWRSFYWGEGGALSMLWVHPCKVFRTGQTEITWLVIYAESLLPPHHALQVQTPTQDHVGLL